MPKTTKEQHSTQGNTSSTTNSRRSSSTATLNPPAAGQKRATTQSRPSAATQIRKTGSTSGSRAAKPAEPEKPSGPIELPANVVVKDFAEALKISPMEVIRELIKRNVFASINQAIEFKLAEEVAIELGYEVKEIVQESAAAKKREPGELAFLKQGNLVTRWPVVTVMGHVDHGKTSLLDTIRKTRVAAGEAGGITQHIAAYQVEIRDKKITFLDTPGHEAFTAMRARGAQATDVAVIVVAADDGVMPQTLEAIDHARAAEVPIIIALNKIDKPGANPDLVKQQLAETDVVVEEYGGDVVCVPVSAKKDIGIDDLLEMILLVTEMQDLKANLHRPASGVIIEAKMDKTMGSIATVLIQQGVLKLGDYVVAGTTYGKVRAMFSDTGKRLKKAEPSTPVGILGLVDVPQAGDRLEEVSDERTARTKAAQAANKARATGGASLEGISAQAQQGELKELVLLVKADVQGSIEAIKHTLSKLNETNLKVRMVHDGVGNITESDIHLAAASRAIIIGFGVKADPAAQRVAQNEGVDIRHYNIIYKLVEDIEAALSGMLEPTYHEEVEGHAEVLQLFKVGKTTIIAGSRVTDGKFSRSNQVRILRNNDVVHDGKIGTLRRGKDDVREVATGFECGITIESFNQIEVGDIIEAYSMVRD